MHGLVDADSGVILARRITEARSSAERWAALEMLDQLAKERPWVLHETGLLGDKNYCTRSFLAEVEKRGLRPYISVRSDLKRRELPSYKRQARDPLRNKKRLDKQRVIEAANRLLERSETAVYRAAQSLRLVNERLFAEAKQLGMDRARYRGRPKVEQQALMTAAVQNIRRLLAWVSRRRSAPALSLAVRKHAGQTTHYLFVFHDFLPFFSLA